MSASPSADAECSQTSHPQHKPHRTSPRLWVAVGESGATEFRRTQSRFGDGEANIAAGADREGAVMRRRLVIMVPDARDAHEMGWADRALWVSILSGLYARKRSIRIPAILPYGDFSRRDGNTILTPLPAILIAILQSHRACFPVIMPRSRRPVLPRSFCDGHRPASHDFPAVSVVS